MSTKQCLKCNHIVHFEGGPPLACPQCGAVYSKVEETLRNGPPVRRRQEEGPPPSRISNAALDMHAFAEQMRDESLYPAWRKIVGLVTIVWYLVAVVAFIIGIVSTNGSFVGVLEGAGTAAFIALFARVGKELSLMVADLSDATVYMAARAARSE